MGRRLTMAASRIVMCSIGKSLHKILSDADIKVWMKSAYCNDIREVITLLCGVTRGKVLKLLTMQ